MIFTRSKRSSKVRIGWKCSRKWVICVISCVYWSEDWYWNYSWVELESSDCVYGVREVCSDCYVGDWYCGDCANKNAVLACAGRAAVELPVWKTIYVYDQSLANLPIQATPPLHASPTLAFDVCVLHSVTKFLHQQYFCTTNRVWKMYSNTGLSAEFQVQLKIFLFKNTIYG